MRIALSVLQDAQLDLVFSDVDNVFRYDPFLPGIELGDRIRSQNYDLLFQADFPLKPDRSKKEWLVPRNPDTEYGPGEIKEGNTGFYYAASRDGMMALVKSTIHLPATGAQCTFATRRALA